MKRSATLFIGIFALCNMMTSHTKGQLKPITLHPKNQHYFLYNDKATVLITSGEHYGALINLDFNYKTYLEELRSNGLNMTRIFTGAYAEPKGSFKIDRNSLAPGPNRFICPWPRSNEQGYAGGGNKFDLTKWDESYFARIKDLMSVARENGVVVEFTFFCPFYDDSQWAVSPMNAVNNVNGIGNGARTDVYTLDRNGSLLLIQDSLVRKMVETLNEYENLIFEICNEPYFGGVTMEWQHHIASLIQETEKKLKKTHLISQNIANGSALITDPHPGVSVFNFHYATPPVAVTKNYHLNKCIGDNETGFKAQADSTYRKEGWEFILAGGALYNNLDYSFAPSFEKGTYKYGAQQPGGGSTALRQQLRYLKTFVEKFDFVSMKPDSTVITDGIPAGARAHVLTEPGKQYAVYVLHGNKVNFGLNLPAGKYSMQWLDPVTGEYSKKKTLRHAGGRAELASPAYVFDIALRIVAK